MTQFLTVVAACAFIYLFLSLELSRTPGYGEAVARFLSKYDPNWEIGH